MSSSWKMGSSPGSGGLMGSFPSGGGAFKWMEANHRAKQFWKKLLYDANLEPHDFSVGYVDSQVKAQRKSGKDAWSERVAELLVERPFLQLSEAWGDNVPFHKIKYFKENGAVVWMAESSRSEQAAASSSSALTATRLRGSSPTGSHSSSEQPAHAEANDSDTEATSRAPALVDLPADCWRIVAAHLETRDICALSCCCSSARDALHHLLVWSRTYKALFGRPPEPAASVDVVKLQCRMSELQAWDWFHTPVAHADVGFPGTSCVVMDDSKAASADGANVRLWSLRTGKRFAVLKAAAPVSRIAMSERHLAAMEDTVVRVWDIDDLKAARAMRCAAPLSDVCFFASGILLAAQRDGCVKVFDPDAAGQAVVMELQQPHGVDAVACMAAGQLVTAGGAMSLWDMQYGTEVVQFYDGSSEALSTLASMFPHYSHVSSGSTRFSSVAVAGNLLAAATPTFLALWDVRSANAVSLFSAASHPLWQSHAPCAPVGVWMDAYKLVIGVGSGVTVHDLRATSSSNTSGTWPRTVHTLVDAVDGVRSERSRCESEGGAGETRQLDCVACNGNAVLAGYQGLPCHLWAFGRDAASVCQTLDTHASQHGDDEDKRKKKEKKAPPPKRQNRYPKRASR